MTEKTPTIQAAGLAETIINIFKADKQCKISLSWDERFECIGLVMSDGKSSIVTSMMTNITMKSPDRKGPDYSMALSLRSTFHNLKDD